MALAEARAGSAERRGEVYLIGVGPGDPDLLTLRAQQLLQQADVLLYDRLVPEVIIDRARRDAEKINVGKVPGVHDVTQDHINRLLLEHARRGLRVARRQGRRSVRVRARRRGTGGPARRRNPGRRRAGHHGRHRCRGERIGIRSRSGALSQSVTFVTATGSGSGTLNWPALAQPNQTVVFYMGAAQIDHIVAQLMAHGMPAGHPAALIERATWPDERVLRSTLGELPALAVRARLRSPSLLIVGEVAAFAIARDVPETAQPPQSAGAIGEPE